MKMQGKRDNMKSMQLIKIKPNFIYMEKIEGCIRRVINGNGSVYLELVLNDVLECLLPNIQMF